MPVAIPPWIRSAEPAEWYMRGLTMAEARRRADAEMQLHREQMERAELARRAEMNVNQEYRQQMADLRRLEIAEEGKRQKRELEVQEARNKQMSDYQKRMTAINLVRAIREKRESEAKSKLDADVLAEQQAIPIEAAQLIEQGMNPDDAYFQAARNHPTAFKGAGYGSVLRGQRQESGPDWNTKNEIGTLNSRQLKILSDLYVPGLDKSMKEKLDKEFKENKARIEELRTSSGRRPVGVSRAEYFMDPQRGLVRKSDDTVMSPMIPQWEDTSIPEKFQSASPFGVTPGLSLPQGPSFTSFATGTEGVNWKDVMNQVRTNTLMRSLSHPFGQLKGGWTEPLSWEPSAWMQ